MKQQFEQDSWEGFYFNGELMQKWSSCWSLARLPELLQPEKDPCADLSDRDVYIIACKIDHVGRIESADLEIFVYAVQQVLCLLLENKGAVMEALRSHPECGTASLEIFSGLLDGALRMRELALTCGCAFWISGQESDRLKLVESMRRAALPMSASDYVPPPHVVDFRAQAQFLQDRQIARLHRLAQTGNLDKKLRRRLNEIRPGNRGPTGLVQ